MSLGNGIAKTGSVYDNLAWHPDRSSGAFCFCPENNVIDFASHLLNWRRRHNLTERDAAAVLGVSVVALRIWAKPGFPPPIKREAELLERMDKWNQKSK